VAVSVNGPVPVQALFVTLLTVPWPAVPGLKVKLQDSRSCPVRVTASPTPACAATRLPAVPTSSAVGRSLTALTVIVNCWVAVSWPLLAVPPLSTTWTVIVADPFALAVGVYVRL
jgi:hypothetical protein